MTLRRLPAVCIVLAALLAPIPHITAQLGLDRQIVAAESISPAQDAEIDRFVAEWLPRLADPDARECRRAREQLLQPLRERTISVAFRQAYDERLVPGLRAHAQAANDRLIVNILRIAGELAAPNAVNLLQGKLQDAHPPIRYFAVASIGTTFAIVRDHNPALGQQAVEQLIARLDARLQRESEPEILDAIVRSLAVAMEVTRPNHDNIRVQAFQSMTRRISDRAKALGGGAGDNSDELLRVFLRAAHISRDVLADNARPLSEQGVRQAAELNGHLLAYIVRRLQGGGFPQDDPEGRYTAAQIVTVAETTIIMSAAHFRTPVQPLNLSPEFTKATAEGDRAFRDRALDLLGVLTRPPFNFPPSDFGGGR